MINLKQIDSKQRNAFFALKAMPFGNTVYHLGIRRRLAEKEMAGFFGMLKDLKEACIENLSMMEQVLGTGAFQAVMMVDHFDTLEDRTYKMIAANLRNCRSQLDLETCERLIEERVSNGVQAMELKGLAQIRRVELLLQRPMVAE